ncbi:MAG: phosphatase [Egibacteraceae bacterium]
MTTSSDLRAHLVASRLAGRVATTRGSTRGNCRKLAEGDPDYTFGLSDHRTATAEDALEAVRALCGGDPTAGGDREPSWIEPDATLKAIERHRQRLAEFSGGGGRVLLATGHPTGLLAHYATLGRVLAAGGCLVLTPRDETWVAKDWRDENLSIRFVDGVGCVSDGGSLRHTHRSMFMEAMLDALDGSGGAPDLVIGDHGMAGAAIERGVPTLSIADVNDPALPLAQHRGRTDAVLPIDDNLSPRLFIPVTAAMLSFL